MTNDLLIEHALAADVEKEKMSHKNKEKNNQYAREWENRKLQEDPDYRKKVTKRYRENSRLKSLVCISKNRARERGIEHSITERDLQKVLICPYTGLEIDWTASGKHIRNPSVDRIDNSKGYIPGNVEVISSMANTMKSNASVTQLQIFAQEILRRYPLV